MGIKNLFGIKKETSEIVSISDLSVAERGKECGCICPQCHAELVARMGKFRTAHFAHSSEGCDAEKANMIGLFSVIRNYLIAGNSICYPAAKWKFDLTCGSAALPITSQNFDDRVVLISDKEHSKTIVFDSADIIQAQSGYPTAILCKKADYFLAIRVVPPATICKTATRSAYEQYPTLLLDLSYKSFEELSVKKIESILNNCTLFRWLQYVPITTERREKLIEQSLVKCNQLREQQKLAMQAQKQTHHSAESNQYSRKPPISNAASSRTRSASFKPYGKIIRLKRYEMTFDRIVNEPNVVLDADTGERVRVCLMCRRPKTESAFAELPADEQMKNIGICKSCASTIPQK